MSHLVSGDFRPLLYLWHRSITYARITLYLINVRGHCLFYNAPLKTFPPGPLCRIFIADLSLSEYQAALSRRVIVLENDAAWWLRGFYQSTNWSLGTVQDKKSFLNSDLLTWQFFLYVSLLQGDRANPSWWWTVQPNDSQKIHRHPYPDKYHNTETELPV